MKAGKANNGILSWIKNCPKQMNIFLHYLSWHIVNNHHFNLLRDF